MGLGKNLGFAWEQMIRWVAGGTGHRGVHKHWVGMGAGRECGRAGKESHFLIYHLWALECTTTKHRRQNKKGRKKCQLPPE